MTRTESSVLSVKSHTTDVTRYVALHECGGSGSLPADFLAKRADVIRPDVGAAMWRQFRALSAVKQAATAGAFFIGLVMIIAALVGSPSKHNTSATSNGPSTPTTTTAAVSTAAVSPIATSRPAHSPTHATPKPHPTTVHAATTTAPVVAPTHAVAPAPHTTHAAPPPHTTTTAQPSCYPLTNGGNCYEPGEYCRNSDHGTTGIAGDGERIKCEDNNGWRWEPI